MHRQRFGQTSHACFACPPPYATIPSLTNIPRRSTRSPSATWVLQVTGQHERAWQSYSRAMVHGSPWPQSGSRYRIWCQTALSITVSRMKLMYYFLMLKSTVEHASFYLVRRCSIVFYASTSEAENATLTRLGDTCAGLGGCWLNQHGLSLEHGDPDAECGKACAQCLLHVGLSEMYCWGRCTQAWPNYDVTKDRLIKHMSRMPWYHRPTRLRSWKLCCGRVLPDQSCQPAITWPLCRDTLMAV